MCAVSILRFMAEYMLILNKGSSASLSCLIFSGNDCYLKKAVCKNLDLKMTHRGYCRNTEAEQNANYEFKNYFGYGKIIGGGGGLR